MGAGGSSRSGVSSEAASRQRARSFGILCTEPVAPSPRPHPHPQPSPHPLTLFQSVNTWAISGTVSPPTTRSTSYASAMSCMSPYSMPLCTIFT